MSATRVAALAELDEAVAHLVVVDGTAVTLVRLGDSVYAIGDRCSHADVSLSGGEVDPTGCTIECPQHGSEFDLRTGEALTLPATRPVPVWDVEVRDAEVWLESREVDA